jgi:hypothetical protein
MDHHKNAQRYAVFMDRQRLYGAGQSKSPSPSAAKSNQSLLPDENSPFKDLVHPSKSPRFLRADKLDIKDIKGT